MANPNNNSSSLVFTTRGLYRGSIQSYPAKDPLSQHCSDFIDAIINAKRRVVRTDRLNYHRGQLFYSPSNEYKQYVVRMKKIK